MRKHLASATIALLSLTMATAYPATATAQSTPSGTPTTLVLKSMQLNTDLLDSVEDTFAGNDGPACTDLISLYNATQSAPGSTPANCDMNAFGFQYLIVNFVDWNSSATAQPVSKWYLLSPANPRRATVFSPTAASSLRIFGSRRVAILLLHRGVPNPDAADARYTLTVTHKASVQASDLNALISIIAAPAMTAADMIVELPSSTETVLAIATSAGTIPRLPYDIALAGQVVLDAKASTKPDATFTQTYDDEGYAHWDISAAIPVTGIKDVQYTQMGSTVTAKTVTRANAYALAHYYPFKVDLKGDYPWQPSVVAGLPLSGAPLDKPFVGMAIGTRKPFPFQVNVFAGAVFNKVFTSASATDATQLNSHRVTKLLYGIDVPIGQLVKAISGKS